MLAQATAAVFITTFFFNHDGLHYVTSSSVSSSMNTPKQPIHIAFACDTSNPQQLRLLGAAARSIVLHSDEPRRLSFHVFVGEGEESRVRKALLCAASAQPISVYVTSVNSDIVDLPVKVRFPGKSEQRLLNHFNYVRFYLHRLMPDVDKVLYLDTDVIVLTDVSSLFDEHLVGEGTPILAAGSRSQPLSKWANFSDPEILRARLNPNTPAFNAGVLLIRLDRWREQNVTEQVRFWMNINRERALYQHGSQPPLLLSVGDKYERFDLSWNVDGAGFRRIQAKVLKKAKIIHWTGGKKGDEDDSWHHDVWEKFHSSECYPFA